MKTGNLSEDAFKKTCNLDIEGRHLILQYGHVILISGYTVLTVVNCPQHGCAISGCKLPLRKGEISHCQPCGAGTDRRGDSNVTTKINKQIFSATTYGLFYNVHCRVILSNFQFLTVFNSRYLEGCKWLHVPTHAKVIGMAVLMSRKANSCNLCLL